MTKNSASLFLSLFWLFCNENKSISYRIIFLSDKRLKIYYVIRNVQKIALESFGLNTIGGEELILIYDLIFELNSSRTQQLHESIFLRKTTIGPYCAFLYQDEYLF